jgi:LysM repeat protein
LLTLRGYLRSAIAAVRQRLSTRVSRLRPDAAARAVALPRLLRHALVIALVLLVLLGEMAFAWSRQAAAPVVPAEAVPLAGSGPPAELIGSSVPYEVPFSLALADVRTISEIPPTTAGDTTSGSALAAPLRPPEAVLTPAFQATHTLAEGETLGQLATRYGVSLESLIWANGLYNGDILAVGQELRIPRVSGVPHLIQEGDTLAALEQRYGVPAEIIVDFRDNGLRLDGPLPVGREIFIPGGQAPLPAALLERRGDLAAYAALQAQLAGMIRAERTNMRAGPDTVYERVAQLGPGAAPNSLPATPIGSR